MRGVIGMIEASSRGKMYEYEYRQPYHCVGGLLFEPSCSA